MQRGSLNACASCEKTVSSQTHIAFKKRSEVTTITKIAQTKRVSRPGGGGVRVSSGYSTHTQPALQPHRRLHAHQGVHKSRWEIVKIHGFSSNLIDFHLKSLQNRGFSRRGPPQVLGNSGIRAPGRMLQELVALYQRKRTKGFGARTPAPEIQEKNTWIPSSPPWTLMKIRAPTQKVRLSSQLSSRRRN
jgi:hypothetical protein